MLLLVAIAANIIIVLIFLTQESGGKVTLHTISCDELPSQSATLPIIAAYSAYSVARFKGDIHYSNRGNLYLRFEPGDGHLAKITFDGWLHLVNSMPSKGTLAVIASDGTYEHMIDVRRGRFHLVFKWRGEMRGDWLRRTEVALVEKGITLIDESWVLDMQFDSEGPTPAYY